MAFMYGDLEILLHHTQFICKGFNKVSITYFYQNFYNTNDVTSDPLTD